MSPALTDPGFYAEVYQRHLSFIRIIIRRAGCPHRLMDDVTSEVITAILAADGLAKYDPSRSSLVTYLHNYVGLAARHALARIRLQESRQAPLDPDLDVAYTEPSPAHYEAFLDQLLTACPDDESRAFVLHCTTAASYVKAREEMLVQGWQPLQIRRTVRRTRSALRPVAACAQ